MPYRFWDSLAFGSWSRSIAETGEIWAKHGRAEASRRPLFYVPQGWLWRFVTEDEWIGRHSLGYVRGGSRGLGLGAGATAVGRTGSHAALLPSLAVLALLSSAVLAANVAAGMTDVPVAAASAATARRALVARCPPARRSRSPPSAPRQPCSRSRPDCSRSPDSCSRPAVLRAARRARALVGVGVGIALGLAYDAWQASRLDVSPDGDPPRGKRRLLARTR